MRDLCASENVELVQVGLGGIRVRKERERDRGDGTNHPWAENGSKRGSIG